jgi:hypothetical protein
MAMKEIIFVLQEVWHLPFHTLIYSLKWGNIFNGSVEAFIFIHRTLQHV